MAIGKAARWISFAAPQQTPSSSSVANDTDDTTHSIADEKQFGLENFGNTCYANSVLQALYFCSPFRDLVIQSTDISAPPLPAAVSRQTPPTLPTVNPILPRRKSERAKIVSDVPSSTPTPTLLIPSAPPTLFSALRSLYVFISRNPADKGAVAPRAFIDKLRDGNEHFRGVMHQDAHEFLNYLLNKIVEEIQYDKHHKHQDRDMDSYSSNASQEDLSSTAVATVVSNNASTPTAPEFPDHSGTLVHRLFEGSLTSETRCLTCETVSSRDESFLDLSIDIEQNSSVTACLRQFSASEMLCQRNKFFCDSCCGLQEAEKRMKIKKLPNVLALHLKRFKYQEDLKKYVKLTYRVAFPLELRLFNTVDDVEDPDRLYELFGIVVHIGSGPHHGHYVAIVKGPHSWLVFDDDKIEAIKESEITRYFGDATSGSAYVLYYQAVDLDPVSLGIKVPDGPTVPDSTIAGSPAYEANGLPSLELPDPALPPGLGESPAASLATEPTPHPPKLTAPSSPSLATMPLVASVILPSRKKSLPSIRIPAPDSSNTPIAISGRAHGGLFNTFRSSPSGSKARPSTSDGTVSTRIAADDGPPPVPPVPLQYLNGKDTKEHDKDKDKDKGGEKEREEERSSKEFDRRPSLWFKRRTTKPTKEEREKEKEKDKDKEREKVSLGILSAGDATTSAAALAAVPSQSDAASSVSGAGSLWRRSSARVGYHVKRLSGSGINGSTALGEAEVTVTAPPADVSSASSPSSHPPSHPHPHPHPHSHSHHHHHHHHHNHPEPPGQLPTVPATPQIGQSDWEPSTPSSTSSSPLAPRTLHAQAQHRTPLLVNNTDYDDPPPLPASGGEAEANNSSPLPAWRISPASPPGESSGSAKSAVLPRHHNGEPTSMVDDNDEGEDDDNDDVVSDDHEPEHEHEHGHGRRRLRAPAGLRFFAGRRRGRQHSAHGSSGSGGSRSPRERSTSPHQQYQRQRQEVAAAATTVPSPHSPSAPKSSGRLNFPSQSASDTPAPAPSSATSSSNSAAASGPAAGLRRAARKLSLNVPLFGLGLGLGGGGRDKDRDPQHHSHPHPSHEHHQHHLGIVKREESSSSSHKTPQKIRMPSSIFGSGGSGADAGAAVGVSAALTTSALP